MNLNNIFKATILSSFISLPFVGYSMNILESGFNLTNECIRDCKNEELSVETALRGYLDISRVITKYDDKYELGYVQSEEHLADLNYKDFKTFIPCLVNDGSGARWTQERHADKEFHVKGFERSASELDYLNVDEAKIFKGQHKDQTLVPSLTKVRVNHRGDVVKFQYLQNTTTKKIEAIHFSLSECSVNSDHSPQTTSHSPIEYISIWKDRDIGLRVEFLIHSQPNIKEVFFGERDELLYEHWDHITSITEEFGPYDRLWRMVLERKLYRIAKNIRNHNRFREDVFDLIMVMILKYKDDGLSQEEVIERIGKIYGSTETAKILIRAVKQEF